MRRAAATAPARFSARGVHNPAAASHRAASHESDEPLRRRLRQAVLEVDLAAIHTIHGFCSRVLREHALESGFVFSAPELLGNDRDLRAELAAERDSLELAVRDRTKRMTVLANHLLSVQEDERARLARELLVSVREAVGDDVAVIAKLLPTPKQE